jgi:hypothetical protein
VYGQALYQQQPSNDEGSPLSKESGGIFIQKKKDQSLRYLMYFNRMIRRSLQRVIC